MKENNSSVDQKTKEEIDYSPDIPLFSVIGTIGCVLPLALFLSNGNNGVWQTSKY